MALIGTILKARRHGIMSTTCVSKITAWDPKILNCIKFHVALVTCKLSHVWEKIVVMKEMWNSLILLTIDQDCWLLRGWYDFLSTSLVMSSLLPLPLKLRDTMLLMHKLWALHMWGHLLAKDLFNLIEMGPCCWWWHWLGED